MGRAHSTNGAKRSAYRILVGKPEEMRPVRRPIRRWVGDNKMDLRKIEWGDMEWTDLAENSDQWRAFLNTVINFPVPLNAGKFSKSCTTGGFTRRALLHGVIYMYTTTFRP
jgi:hypothetical protein